MRTLLLTACLMTMSALPALAQETRTLPPEGATFLNISASERTAVAQDLLIASLRIEAEDKDARVVQDRINTLMKKALERAKAVTSVKTSTGNYYVYPQDVTPPAPMQNGQPAQPAERIWRGSQTLDLQSLNADDLLKLAGELQAMGLMMNNLSYTLSPEKAETVKDSLMEKALSKVRARAERAARAMDKTKTDLIELNVDTADSMIAPQAMMMRGAAMDASAKMETPVAEPGETEITLTVSARALLRP